MEVIHGGDIYSCNKKILDFSANINPLGTPKEVQTAFLHSAELLNIYPDIWCRELRAEIAKKYGIDAGSIVCGNGAAELIYNIVQSFKPKKALLCAPSFAEYSIALDTVGAAKLFYTLSEKNDFCLNDDFIQCIDDTIDMVFLCNPNNPTGRAEKNTLVTRILENMRSDALLVADECFADFVQDGGSISALPYISKYKNLFVIKAFTKMYALPGLRLGYGICGSREIIEGIYSVRQPWNVSTAAQAAGIAALKLKELPEITRQLIYAEKQYIYESFDRLGIVYFKSDANFVLFKCFSGLDKMLLQKGILIRNCGNYRGLNNCFYRTAVRCHGDNIKLINAIEHIKNGGN